MAIVSASRKKQKARIGLIGGPGCGKTFTALTFAEVFAASGGGNGKIGVIDTEKGSASKYAPGENDPPGRKVFNFDVEELTSYAPRDYIRSMREFADAGYPVLVIDSASHSWEGEGGILDQVDQRGGRFESWKDMKPQEREFIDAWLTYPGHLIITFRAKVEYVVEKNDKGKSEPRKVGLAPRFKDGAEFELDVVGYLDDQNILTITKTRCVELSGLVKKNPGPELAQKIAQWLDGGIDDEKRIAALLAKAEGEQDLTHAREEIKRAMRIKSIDRAAAERLGEAGRAAAERISPKAAAS